MTLIANLSILCHGYHCGSQALHFGKTISCLSPPFASEFSGTIVTRQQEESFWVSYNSNVYVPHVSSKIIKSILFEKN